jgi:hypothetical protein
VAIFFFLWFGPWIARGTHGLSLLGQPALVTALFLGSVGGLLAIVTAASRKPDFLWWKCIVLCVLLAVPAYLAAWAGLATVMVVLAFLIDWEATPLVRWFGSMGRGGGHMPFPDLTPIYLAMVCAGPVAAALLAPLAAAYGSVAKGVWLWRRAVVAVAAGGAILSAARLLLLTRS